MKVSKFGQKIAKVSGIGRLMDDLGDAIAERRDVLMLGGGNPAHTPQVQRHFRDSTPRLLETGGEFKRAFGNYDPPQGSKQFIEAVAGLLRSEFGRDIKTNAYA